MTKPISLRKNFIFKAAYDILIIISPLITGPYLGRVLGAEKLGEYSFYYAVANCFVLFSKLGIDNYGNRTIAACRDEQEKLNATFSSILCSHGIFSFLSIGAYILLSLFVLDDKVCALMMSLIVLSSFTDITWLYFGLERFQFATSINFVIKLLSIASILIFVNSSEDLYIYTLIMAGTIFLYQTLLWFPIKRFVKFVRPSIRDVISHIKPMLVLFVPVLAVSLYKVFNRIMISEMSDMNELGYYDNAEKLVILPMVLIGSFSSVMLPRMSNLIAKKDSKQTGKYMEMLFFFVMWLAYGCTFGLVGVSEVFAPVFWGDEFEPAGILIAGLSTSIPFIAFAEVIRKNYIIPANKDRDYIVSVVAGAIINPILNLVLIPGFNALGAVISTLITEIIVCALQIYAVRKNLPMGKYFRQTMIFIPVATIMMFGVYEIGQQMGRGVLTLLVQVLVGGLFYLAVTAGFIYLKREQFGFIQIRRSQK